MATRTARRSARRDALGVAVALACGAACSNGGDASRMLFVDQIDGAAGVLDARNPEPADATARTPDAAPGDAGAPYDATIRIDRGALPGDGGFP